MYQWVIAFFPSYIMAKTISIPWDDDDVGVVLDQHTLFDLYNVSSLKQQFEDRHVTPLGQIILIQSQSSLPLLLNAELSAQRRSNKC